MRQFPEAEINHKSEKSWETTEAHKISVCWEKKNKKSKAKEPNTSTKTATDVEIFNYLLLFKKFHSLKIGDQHCCCKVFFYCFCIEQKIKDKC